MSEEATTIPIERLNKEIAKRRDAEARTAEVASSLDQLKAHVAGLEAKAARGDEHAKQIAALQQQQERDLQKHLSVVSLLEDGVRDSSVREFLLHGFEKQSTGEGAQDWEAWWAEQRDNPSAVLKPFLSNASADEPIGHSEAKPLDTAPPQSTSVAASNGGQIAPAISTPRANGGAMPSPTPGRYEGSDFARMASSNPSQFIERLRSGEFNN